MSAPRFSFSYWRSQSLGSSPQDDRLGSPPGTQPHQSGDADRYFLVAVFLIVAVANVLITTNNWSSGFLLGHEFRQSQTALIARYIDEQNNFSPRYETPIMGKPWEVPLELPIYEWAVVLLSRATHWNQVESARAVSLCSFYLALPALYLLLRAIGLCQSRRLLVLSFVLATPVYLFYARAFLMDTMALMFSAWFLAGFIETMQTRKLGWFIVCTLMGTAAGLLKSLTFFAWVFPAALYGGYCLWRNIVGRSGVAAVIRTVAWGAGTMVLPSIGMAWWVRLTDAIKENHSSAYFLTSWNLSHQNYGTFALSSRLAATTWREWFARWQEAITFPWAILGVIAFGVVFLARERWRVVGAFVLFMAPQMMIPYAYTGQDYYYVACAVFAVFALGFVANGVMDLSWPRWSRWLAILASLASLYFAYANYYFPQHRIWSPGGTGLTIALRDYLPRDSVLIIAGSDWGPIIPYYSHHRALMIRNGLEGNDTYLERAFNDIADEDVSALVLTWNQRSNKALLKRAAAKFNLDPEPTFSYINADVYVSRFLRSRVLDRLAMAGVPENISSTAKPGDTTDNRVPTVLTRGVARLMLPMVKPGPIKVRFDHGYQIWNIDGVDHLNAHPNSEIWVVPPPGAKSIECEFGLLPGAYEREPDKTNGAEFSVGLESADGRPLRRIFYRLLDPARNAADRGVQHETIPFSAQPGEVLVFRTGPNQSFAFDWCYWRKIDVH